jgi:CCR4-NOT transcription complex subunit 1
MSAGAAVQSANSGLTGTNGPAPGQINPGYSLNTGYEGVSRPLDDMPESNFAQHFRCAIFVQHGVVIKILQV